MEIKRVSKYGKIKIFTFDTMYGLVSISFDQNILKFGNLSSYAKIPFQIKKGIRLDMVSSINDNGMKFA